MPRYRELYKRGAYAPQAERERLARLVGQGPRWPEDLRGVAAAKRAQARTDGPLHAAPRAARAAAVTRAEEEDVQQALF